MRMFVVRLNPDPRDGWPYSKYVSEEEYKTIHDASPMDGFHEAVNFLSESGVVRGYLPPRHSAAMRTGEPFVLLTITAKTAKVGGDKIVGIQAGCVGCWRKPCGKASATNKGSPGIIVALLRSPICFPSQFPLHVKLYSALMAHGLEGRHMKFLLVHSREFLELFQFA